MSLNVTFRRASIEAAMEFGSLKELAGYVGEESILLTKIFGDDMEIVVKGLSDSTALATGTVETETTTEATAGKKRGRPVKGADPATAVAPPPAPIPGATPPAPAAVPADLAAQNAAAAAGGGVPDYLKAAAPPAPPAPPPAPAAPPVLPPSGILAGKVIAALDARAANDDAKAQLVAWLASPHFSLVTTNATYDEAVAAIRLMGDDKLASVATGLAVA
jgi:hypothetical protein